jgi:hypothetical protein
MGSFSELVMSFPLRADVGAEVLAAFASIAVPNPDAPPLPPAIDDRSGDWWPDEPECDMSDPWSHDWGSWLGSEGTISYIGSDQGATMVWRHRQWVVTSRATWKAAPEEFIENLAVLGSIIDATISPRYDAGDGGDGLITGFFVGYARFEYEPRPWLLWADGHRLLGENLNPPGYSS